MLTLDKSREELALLFKGEGAEIGVERGYFSEVICKQSPGVKLHCIDAWESYAEYRDHERQNKLNMFYRRAKWRLRNFNCHFIKKFSSEAVKEFKDGQLDFVYIDANHSYKYTTEDINLWSKKVKKGGIVAGHDFIDRPERGETYKVKEAVLDYVKEHNIETLTIYTNANSPSWMFINP